MSDDTEQTDRPADDVEGHAIHSNRSIRAGRATTAARIDDDPADADEVAGHAYRRSFTDEPADDDVEGHISGALGAQQRD